MYEVRAYFDYKNSALDDSFTTSDFDLAVDFSHNKLMQGYNITIKNLDTGIEKEILSDEYYNKWEENNGEFTYSYEDFEKGAE